MRVAWAAAIPHELPMSRRVVTCCRLRRRVLWTLGTPPTFMYNSRIIMLVVAQSLLDGEVVENVACALHPPPPPSPLMNHTGAYGRRAGDKESRNCRRAHTRPKTLVLTRSFLSVFPPGTMTATCVGPRRSRPRRMAGRASARAERPAEGPEALCLLPRTFKSAEIRKSSGAGALGAF